jgi:hypothetical protein
MSWIYYIWLSGVCWAATAILRKPEGIPLLHPPYFYNSILIMNIDEYAKLLQFIKI